MIIEITNKTSIDLELLPCPFCGFDAFCHIWGLDCARKYTLGCNHCEFKAFTTGPIEDLMRASCAWNLRKFK